MHCRSGNRSEAMIDYLEVHHKFQNLHNLTGGILAWSDEVDTSIIPF
jgi:rhodanese-related sulfurtransferase